MENLRTNIERINEDYTVVYNDSMYDYLKTHSLKEWGFGQDYHTVERTPDFSVFKLKKSDWIEYKGDVFQALSWDHNSNTIYLELSYSEAKYNASEYDGRGKGYRVC